MELTMEENKAKEDYLESIKKIHRISKEYPWISRWVYLKLSCEDSACAGYKNFGALGVKFFLTADEAKFIWQRDGGCNFRKPRMTRVDNCLPFTLGNSRIVEGFVEPKRKKLIPS